MVEELTGGLKHSLNRAALGIKGLLPQSVQDFGDALDKSMNNAPLDANTLKQGQAFVDQTGAASTVGDLGGDVAMTLAPGAGILKGARLATAGMKGIPRALAMLGLEAGGNAGVSAAIAPEDRQKAAILGGAGSVLGSAANRLVSGPLAQAVSPEARALMDKGVGPTIGQMVSGADAGFAARTLRRAEDAIQSLPFLGDVPKGRSIVALKDYNKAEFNSILKPLGEEVDKVGHAGIQAVKDAILKKKTEYMAKVHVPASEATTFLDDMNQHMDQLPLVSVRHRKWMDDWLESYVVPELKKGDIDGPEAVKILRGLEMATGAAKKRMVSDPMAEGLHVMLDQYAKGWEQQLVGKLSPQEAIMMKRVARAELRLKPFETAADKSAEGVFSPMQVVQALRQHPANNITTTTAQARAVLPETVPDTGTGLRTALYHMMSPSGISGAAGLAAYAGTFGALTPFLAAAAGGSLAYTKLGTKYLAEGIKPVLDKLTGRPIDRATMEQVVKLLSQQGGGAGLKSIKDMLNIPGE